VRIRFYYFSNPALALQLTVEPNAKAEGDGFFYFPIYNGKLSC